MPMARRQLQQTIHLPPNAIPPATPFRSQSTSHPNYVKTTEHLKKEQEAAMRQLSRGIAQMMDDKIRSLKQVPPGPPVPTQPGPPRSTQPLPHAVARSVTLDGVAEADEGSNPLRVDRSTSP